jgi:fructosamine-3-kinase
MLFNLVFTLYFTILEDFVEKYISIAIIESGIKNRKNINVLLTIISKIHTTSFQYLQVVR